MRKAIITLAATAAVLGGTIAVATPAQAYTYKEDVVISLVRGDESINPRYLPSNAKIVDYAHAICAVLGRGATWAEIDASTARAARSMNLSATEARGFAYATAGVQTAAVVVLCPRFKSGL
jgi:hypothetical protein